LRTWIKSFFVPQLTIVNAPIKASKTQPLLWQWKMKKWKRFVLHNLQMRGAFIAAFKVKNDGWRSKQVYSTIAN
jgi:hypothetical protein